MRWAKLGCIFNIGSKPPYMVSHAQLPVVLPLGEDRGTKVRVYFCSRDAEIQSRPFYFEGEITENGFEVTKIMEQPLLDLGKPGMFDDSGVMFSSWLVHDNALLMYYIGWTRRVKVPYQLSIGLAISHDGGLSFKRYADGPILTCNSQDSFCVSRPVVVKHMNIYVMLYWFSDGWVDRGDEKELWYGLAVTESDNPYTFSGERRHIQLFDRSVAYAPSSVLKKGDEFIVFLCVRGVFDFRTDPTKSYRVYYTKTRDFVEFTPPQPASGLEPNGEGFDSTMSEYLWVFKSNSDVFGMYNGDGFGKTGVGLAKLTDL